MSHVHSTRAVVEPAAIGASLAGAPAAGLPTDESRIRTAAGRSTAGAIVLAIVGPTASGKSELALRAAQALGGEIVSADSRLVYCGLDIGTAKPTAEERARVPHHCIDLVDPGERYDAARYQRDARTALEEIAVRGRPAVVTGGTGLYVRALLDDLDLAARPADAALRGWIERLAEREGADAVLARLARLDPEAAARTPRGNVRRAIRYLEVALLREARSGAAEEDGSGRAEAPGSSLDAADPPDVASAGKGRRGSLRIGLAPPRAHLERAIDERVQGMVAHGVLEETRRLVARGLDPRTPSMTAHGYVHWARHLAGEIGLDEAIVRTARDTRAYARRQMTWFRRDPLIRWFDPTAADLLPAILEAACAS